MLEEPLTRSSADEIDFNKAKKTERSLTVKTTPSTSNSKTAEEVSLNL
jgi:hypothetical protein